MMIAFRLAPLLLLVCSGIPAQDETSVQKNVEVPMKDGTTLATDVYLPPGGGKVPTILSRTPYDKNGEKGNAAYFSKHGYAFVAQDTRGRYASQGTWTFLADDGKDGEDCIAW